MKKKHLVVLVPFILLITFFVFNLNNTNTTKKQCPPDCNVILIVVDTLRADHLGCYGYERDTAPNLCEFAKDAILFENVRSQAACTFPSVNSILTSRYPFVFLDQPDERIDIPDHIKSLPEIFKDRNYSTIAISASPVVRKNPSKWNKFGGFDKGFDFFNDECCCRPHGDAVCVNNKLFGFLGKMENPIFIYLEDIKKPFFVYLHYMDVHDHYAPPKEYVKRFAGEYEGKEFIKEGRPGPIGKMLYKNGSYVNVTEDDIQHLIDLYDDEIAYWDSQFKILLNKLSEKNLTNNTIIIIAADHGEEFMEHNNVMHCHTLFDTETKTPLVVRIPSVEGGKRIAMKVQNLDITPTILDYLNFNLNEYSFEGKSLRSIIESNADINEYVFSLQNTLRSVNDDHYKLIYDLSSTNVSLYDLKKDSGETKNVIDTEVEAFGKLKERLFKWLYIVEGADVNKSVEISEEALERLKALGYVN